MIMGIRSTAQSCYSAPLGKCGSTIARRRPTHEAQELATQLTVS